MKKQSLGLVFALFLGTSSLSAQQGWFVDPVGGSDLNGGQSQGDAVKTLGHALTLAAAGDNVFCVPGTYTTVTGETYPIGVKNGVRISGLGGIPVFDGGGAATMFNLGGNITQETELSGLSFTNGLTLFAIQSGRSVDGLRLQDCSFSGPQGFVATLNTSAIGQNFEVTGCTFTSAGGNLAMFVTVDDGVLDDGGFTGNQVLGDFNTGVSINTHGDGNIAAGFMVKDNTIAGCDFGLFANATGSGGNGLNVATTAATVLANSFTGTGSVGGTGMNLVAEVGVLGEGAQVSCYICFNEVTDYDVAVLSSTDNDTLNLADVISDFYGNVFSGTGTGVQIEASQPAPLNRNSDPNFGGHPAGGVACFNTFNGFALDFDLAVTQSTDQYACFCWFDGAPVSQDGTLLTPPILDDPLQATVSGSIAANTVGEVLTLTAAATSGFVDYDLDGGIGQIAIEVDGVAIPQSDITAPVPGTSLTITLPSLVAGLHTLDVLNPGGQPGIFDFLVGGGSNNSNGTGCFVATAAHGDYNAPEVLALRGLRDQYLANSVPGRSFIRWYYREGPAAANWIAVRPWARAATRVALQPAVWTSRALTNWNPGERFAFALLMVGATFALVRRRNP